MHVFIGGAYNGKREFVKNWLGNEPATFCTMETLHEHRPGTRLVVTDLDQWLLTAVGTEEELAAAVWKVTETANAVFILTDMGRGIVPMQPELRQLRDRCGRLYQQILSKAETVTRIWYGIGQTIK